MKKILIAFIFILFASSVYSMNSRFMSKKIKNQGKKSYIMIGEGRSGKFYKINSIKVFVGGKNLESSYNKIIIAKHLRDYFIVFTPWGSFSLVNMRNINIFKFHNVNKRAKTLEIHIYL